MISICGNAVEHALCSATRRWTACGWGLDRKTKITAQSKTAVRSLMLPKTPMLQNCRLLHRDCTAICGRKTTWDVVPCLQGIIDVTCILLLCCINSVNRTHPGRACYAQKLHNGQLGGFDGRQEKINDSPILFHGGMWKLN